MPRKKNTRAAQGTGSIRQRPDGRWEARITVGTNPGTGKPIRRSIYGDTQAAVRKEMTSLLREIDRGTYQTPSRITVKEWLKTWLETYCTGLKPLTVSAYDTAIRTHILPAIGAVQLQAVKGIQIQKLYNVCSPPGSLRRPSRMLLPFCTSPSLLPSSRGIWLPILATQPKHRRSRARKFIP